MAFLFPTGDASTPWTFGPQGLHIWCTFDTEVQSVIDAVPVGATVDPMTFEQEISDVINQPPVFDFVDVPSRVLAVNLEDLPDGDFAIATSTGLPQGLEPVPVSPAR